MLAKLLILLLELGHKQRNRTGDERVRYKLVFRLAAPLDPCRHSTVTETCCSPCPGPGPPPRKDILLGLELAPRGFWPFVKVLFLIPKASTPLLLC